MNKNATMMIRLSGALAAVSLAGCAMTGGYQSPDYQLPEGSTVEVTEPLELAPNATRVFIQDGIAMRGDEVDQWSSHCSFGLNRRGSGEPVARKIEATKFTTGRTRIGVHASAGTPGYPQLAHNGSDLAGFLVATSGSRGSGENAGTPWPWTYYTEIELYSRDAPQVDALTCEYDGGPVNRNLTLDEIRATLGELVRIY